MNRTGLLHDECGVALPMALMTLSLLTTLLVVFGVLAQTEPIIAANQLRVTQARALAESGFEHAVWALSEGVMAREHHGNRKDKAHQDLFHSVHTDIILHSIPFEFCGCLFTDTPRQGAAGTGYP